MRKQLAAVLLLALPASSFSTVATGRSDTQVYQQYCAVCHATGWNEAPVTGDARAWEARRAAGIDSMLQKAKQGVNAMPPMGSCSDCSDDELRAAIQLMIKE